MSTETMALARINGLAGFALVVLAAALFHGATADDHVVLGRTGWDIPSTADAYTTWAATQDFEVGDNLIFNFATGGHTVAKVTKANYDSCGAANPITMITTGPANVTLTAAGSHYFICTVGTHCQIGQKLAINVTADSDSRPPPASGMTPPTPGSGTRTPPSSTTTPPPPPPSSAASSVVFGGFSTAVLSIIYVFLH